LYNDHAMNSGGGRGWPLLLLLAGAVILWAGIAYAILLYRQQQAAALETPPIYGAIATSGSSLDFGSAWAYGSPAAAMDRALAECNSHAPLHDCIARISLNKNCAALVVSPVHGRSVVAGGNDKASAAAQAFAQCEASGAVDCVVRQNFCGDGS
jgi:hypothetical protein